MFFVYNYHNGTSEYEILYKQGSECTIVFHGFDPLTISLFSGIKNAMLDSNNNLVCLNCALKMFSHPS